MRKMKDSGIVRLGLMPEDWTASRVKYIYAVIGSGTTPSSGNAQYYDGSENWIQSGDLYKTKYVTQTEKTVTDFAVSTISALHKYKADFIIIAMYGASIGNVAISKIDACVNQACCVIKPNSKIHFNYLYYTLVNDRDIMLDMSIGGTQPNISQAKILELPVFLPPLAEQKKIAVFLDEKCGEIDSIKADVQRQIELLNDYKKSVITEAVIKGLNSKVKLKDSGIEWIGKTNSTYDIVRLKDFSYMKGRIGWQGLKSEEFIDEGPYCVTGTDFKNGSIDWSTCYHISEERYKMDSNIHLKIGDLLITKDGTVGKLARISYLPDKACLNSHLLIIRPLKNKFTNDFLYYMMSSDVFSHYCKYAENGTTMASLSQEKMGNFKFPVPPVSEQKEIADYLDEKCSEIDAIIADKQKQLETLDEYKKSLIFEYVTGKKEVAQ